MLDQDVIFSHSDKLLAQVDDFELSKFAIIYVVFFSRLAVHMYTDTVPSDLSHLLKQKPE